MCNHPCVPGHPLQCECKMMIAGDVTIEWRVVPGFPDYEVSDRGVVRRRTKHFRLTTHSVHHIVPQWVRKRRVKRLDGNVTNLDYMCITLCNAEDRKHKNFLVHRLVLITFCGDPPTILHQAAHNDGDRFNNFLENLRWATAAENQADRKRHGTSNCGSRHGLSKINEDDVHNIRRMLAAGVRCRVIALHFNVSYGAITSIMRGSSWVHVT